jgi:hypothetical protein
MLNSLEFCAMVTEKNLLLNSEFAFSSGFADKRINGNRQKMSEIARYRRGVVGSFLWIFGPSKWLHLPTPLERAQSS